MRLSATRSLFERRDVIIVSSVSCIYGLGSPEAYYGMLLPLQLGQRIPREQILRKLVEIQYERNDMDFTRGTFRVRGDVVEVFPSYEEQALRIELFGDDVDALTTFDPLTGKSGRKHDKIAIYPEDALRGAARADEIGGRVDQGRADRASHAARIAGQGARGAASASADDVRSRDDEGDRLLPRHRELFAASDAAALPASRRRRCSIICRTMRC